MRIQRTPLLLHLLEDYDATYQALKDAEQRFSWSGATGSDEKGSRSFTAKSQSLGQTADKIVDSINSRMASSGSPLRIGKRIGQGSSGAVYRGHIPGTVVKFDRGDVESTLARHILDNQDVHGHIRSLPRYYSAEDTGVREKFTGAPIHAIHREDIKDMPRYLHGQQSGSRSIGSMWGAFGDAISKVPYAIRASHIASRIGKPLDDVRARLVRARIRRVIDEHREKFKGTPHEHEFARVSKDIQHLAHHGVIPCDLAEFNWGVRSNGEVVMRDPGCFMAIKPAKPL